MRFIPRSIHGVRIFLGVEANILDDRGTLDLPEPYLQRLDFVMAGLHEGCGFDGEESATYTAAVISAMENPLVKAVSHPGNPAFQSNLRLTQEIIKSGSYERADDRTH